MRNRSGDVCASRLRGFTLIELLFVVAIIGLLLSMLLPALRGAREQAKQLLCVTNLRSMGHAAVFYAEQNNDFISRGEYNTFGDKYTLEIERPDSDDDDATMLGFVFLDSLHYLTAERPTREAATADTAYREERRKLRMTFRLLERWEFSELAEEFVFNRVWELARVQYKPVLAPVPASPAAAPRAVAPPEATPRTR